MKKIYIITALSSLLSLNAATPTLTPAQQQAQNIPVSTTQQTGLPVTTEAARLAAVNVEDLAQQAEGQVKQLEDVRKKIETGLPKLWQKKKDLTGKIDILKTLIDQRSKINDALKSTRSDVKMLKIDYTSQVKDSKESIDQANKIKKDLMHTLNSSDTNRVKAESYQYMPEDGKKQLEKTKKKLDTIKEKIKAIKDDAALQTGVEKEQADAKNIELDLAKVEAKDS